MKPIFADTSFWIALLNPRDALHDKAVSVSAKFALAKIFTSEMVLVELLNGFSEGGPRARQVAAELAEALHANRRVDVIPQTTRQFESALHRYKQAADKSWSLTDCASFQIMQDEQLQAALTHDKHFAQAGYEALLR